MFKHFSKKGTDIPKSTSVALILATIALIAALANLRWSWGLLSFQAEMERDFRELRNAQEQLYIQFDFWDERVSTERAELREELLKLQ